MRVARKYVVDTLSNLGRPRLVIARLCFPFAVEEYDELSNELLALASRKARGCIKQMSHMFGGGHRNEHAL